MSGLKKRFCHLQCMGNINDRYQLTCQPTEYLKMHASTFRVTWRSDKRYKGMISVNVLRITVKLRKRQPPQLRTTWKHLPFGCLKVVDVNIFKYCRANQIFSPLALVFIVIISKTLLRKLASRLVVLLLPRGLCSGRRGLKCRSQILFRRQVKPLAQPGFCCGVEGEKFLSDPLFFSLLPMLLGLLSGRCATHAHITGRQKCTALL